MRFAKSLATTLAVSLFSISTLAGQPPFPSPLATLEKAQQVAGLVQAQELRGEIVLLAAFQPDLTRYRYALQMPDAHGNLELLPLVTDLDLDPWVGSDLTVLGLVVSPEEEAPIRILPVQPTHATHLGDWLNQDASPALKVMVVGIQSRLI